MELPAHIPPAHKEELTRIVRHILKVVKKPEKVILFGSYARGDFVIYDRTVTKDGRVEIYQSDFDIAVITRTRGEAKAGRIFAVTEERVKEDKHIRTPVDWIWEGWDDLNDRLAEGVSFYQDIAKGVTLYDKAKKPFATLRKLTPAQRKKRSREKLEDFLQDAHLFYESYFQDISGAAKIEQAAHSLPSKRPDKRIVKYRNHALFHLHQTAEKTYAGLWEATTGYKPKIHDLHKMADKIEPMYPEVTLFGKRKLRRKDGTTRFEILARGYVDARYDMTFSVTPQTLAALGKKVQALLQTAETILKEKF